MLNQWEDIPPDLREAIRAGTGVMTRMQCALGQTVIALLLLLAVPANAQQAPRIFHDAQGRVTGSARTDANGVTTFHYAAGRLTGSAHTNANGVTTLYDSAGRVTGTARTDRNPDAAGRTVGSIRK